MDGAVAELVGDAGHVVLSLPDELLRLLDAEACIPLHHTVAGLVVEDLLGRGGTHRTVCAYIGKCEILCKVALEKGVGQLEAGFTVLDLIGCQQRMLLLHLGVLDHQLEQERLKVVLDQLLTPEGRRFAPLKLCEKGVAEVGDVVLLRLVDDDRHQALRSLRDAHHLVLEVLHRRRGGDEGDHHQTGAGYAVAFDGMELIRLVEDDLPLLQLVALTFGAGEDHPLVDVEQLPEVMFLAAEDEFVRVFKVVEGDEVSDVNLCFHG